MTKASKITPQTTTAEPGQLEADELPNPLELNSEKAAAGSSAEPDWGDIEASAAASDPEPELPHSEGGGSDLAPSAQILSLDEFRETVRAAFNLPAVLMGPTPALQALTITPDQEAPFEQATEALYETALEVRMFRFLIEPGNKWVQRGFAIVPFVVMKMRLVGEAMAYQRQQAKAPAQNDNQEQGMDSAANG